MSTQGPVNYTQLAMLFLKRNDDERSMLEFKKAYQPIANDPQAVELFKKYVQVVSVKLTQNALTKKKDVLDNAKAEKESAILHCNERLRELETKKIGIIAEAFGRTEESVRKTLSNS